MMKDVWVVIPAYNEQKNISEVIGKTKGHVSNLVVVDDGSVDQTFETAKGLGVIALKHVVNLGKGAALKTGCDYAIKAGAKKIVVIDSDGQHDPKEFPKFVKKLDHAEIVFGIRSFNSKMPFVLKMGNRFINSVTKMLYGIQIKDTQCGYRAFTAGAYRKIRWKSSDYSMESEMIANVGKKQLKYDVVDIETIYSDIYKGTTVFDGLKIVANMILWKFR